MNLTARVRLLRRKTGLSQAKLARLIGVNRSAVANWEADGCGGPSIAHMVALAKIAHVSFEWLATGRGEMGVDPWLTEDPPPVDAALVMEPDELRMLYAWRASSPKARAASVDLMEEAAHKRHGRKKPFARPHDGMTEPKRKRPPPANHDATALVGARHARDSPDPAFAPTASRAWPAKHARSRAEVSSRRLGSRILRSPSRSGLRHPGFGVVSRAN